MPLSTTTRMIAPFLDRMTDEELDTIPYGIVQLDAAGRVLSCNRAEATNAGFASPPVGRPYFDEVAPSAHAAEFYGRFAAGIAAEALDETFAFTFLCNALPRRVQVRMYYSVRTGSMWVFTANPDGSPLQRVEVAA